MPGWVWTVGVPLIGMLIGVPLVVTRGKRDGRDTVQIRIPASEPQAPPWQPQAPPNAIVVKPTIVWVKRTHEASGTTWEFPSMGGRWIDHRASAIDVNGQPVEFSVDIEAIRPEMNRYTQVQMAQLGESYWVSKTVEKIDLFEGRPRLLGRDQSGYSWHVADPNWYYRFGVFNPNADVGGERVKRFLESIRITRAPPPGTRLGEEIPFGWDRVTVSVGIQSEMSALMPQGSPPEWVKRREGLFEGHPTTSRAMPNPKGDEDIVVSMLSLPSGGVFPAPKWFRESKHLTVGGYPAAYSDLANGDFRVVSVRIPVEERQFSYVVVSGYNLDPDAPDVKRVLESVSFTLPKKNGLRPPIDYAPTWARRFAPGTSFSVELPGR